MRRLTATVALFFGLMLQTLHAGSSIGKTIDGFTARDFHGQEISLSDYKSAKLIVVAFLGTECPLAKLYAGRLEKLGQEFADQGVVVLAVNSNVHDSVTEIGRFVEEHKTTYPVIKDVGNRIADLFGAERTPQVFLLDAARTIQYQGRVDDQYVVGIVRDAAEREDLRIAIEELLAKQQVSVPVTEPLGCLIGRMRTADEESPVTYSNQIVRILQDHCIECHRPGEIAPFSLLTYEDAAGWGEMIEEVTQQQRMPPWHADPHFGTFLNDSSLTETEKQQIVTWVEHGCPKGDSTDLPEPLEFTPGWQLERGPDRVIAMAETPFSIPADAGPEGVRYQYFWVDPQFDEDQWIEAAEIRPGNRAVVHHVILYCLPEGKKGKRRELVTAYVPGLRLSYFPDKTAKRIPAGAGLLFEVHYTPIGTPQTDLTEVGLLYADKAEIEQEVRTIHVGNTKFELQPYEDDQTVTAKSRAVDHPVTLISMAPHMHLRGKAFRFEAEYPDGEREVLLNVPHYDFNWQTRYELAEPKVLPAGTEIHCTAVYDNSKDNLANPDPSATVVWGDQSWDEMMLGYMDILVPVTAADKNTVKSRRAYIESLTAEKLLGPLDGDGDQRLTRKETASMAALEQAFDKVDDDDDGFLTQEELDNALRRLRKSLR